MKRYDLEDTASRMSHQTHYEMVERPDGDWVRWEDVEPLMEALRRIDEYDTERWGNADLVRIASAALAK